MYPQKSENTSISNSGRMHKIIVDELINEHSVKTQGIAYKLGFVVIMSSFVHFWIAICRAEVFSFILQVIGKWGWRLCSVEQFFPA